jgi:hypothetical protein
MSLERWTSTPRRPHYGRKLHLRKCDDVFTVGVVSLSLAGRNTTLRSRARSCGNKLGRSFLTPHAPRADARVKSEHPSESGFCVVMNDNESVRASDARGTK